jgi:hypothetical protein
MSPLSQPRRVRFLAATVALDTLFGYSISIAQTSNPLQTSSGVQTLVCTGTVTQLISNKHVGTVENTKTFSVDFENKRVDDLPAKIDERTISFCFPGARSLPESCVNIDRFSGKGSRTSYVGNSEFIYKWNCVKSTRKF